MSKLNLKIPPVALGLIALILMLLLNRWLPLYRLDFTLQAGLSVCTIGLGAWVALLAVIAFVRLGTTVDPRNPDKAGQLVVMGIYRYSRNPMYLGILLMLLGIAIYLGTLSAVIVVVFFAAHIDCYQIQPEEQALEAKFGSSYREYALRVRRWI